MDQGIHCSRLDINNHLCSQARESPQRRHPLVDQQVALQSFDNDAAAGTYSNLVTTFAFSSNRTSPKFHDKTLMCTSANQLEFLRALSFCHQ